MPTAGSGDSTHHGFTPAARTGGAGRAYPFLSPPQAPDEIGRFDDYRVLRLLGSGGMGLVFAAEEISLRRPVAVKILKHEMAADPESRERFLREARAAAEITSDYVVTVLKVGEVAGLPYMVMPLLSGETLQGRIEGPTPLDLRTALVIARDTATGLAAAHARNLIHRDIKPANIWLETDGPGGPFKRARIFDFGLVLRPHVETSLTSTGFIVGTPNYMSPEQAAGHEVDHRADLFALGCAMYTALTGELPFQGNSAMAVMMALANKTPDPVNARNPNVPPRVSDLIARLLAKNPDDRPQSARSVVEDLEPVIDALSGRGPALPPVVTSAAARPRPSSPDTIVPGKSDTRTIAAPPAPPAPPGRRRAAAVGFGLALVLILGGALLWRALRAPTPPGEPIVVGVLHSRTGTMAVSEDPVIDATLLAVDEVNAAGGVNGRLLKPVVADGQSDPEEFARQAEKLLTDEGAKVVFGCWTSASRKAVRPVVERRGGLLFYPVQYEGLEESPRIVYLGPAPNQQLIPAVDFAIDVLKKRRIVLVGSDYIFPRTAHEIIKDRVAERRRDVPDVAVLREVVVPLGSTDVAPAITAIREASADLVINTVNGTTNGAFFRALRGPGGPTGVTTISVSITENEVRGLNPPSLADDYLVASYFQTVDRPQGRGFVAQIQAKYGAERATSDMMAAAYSGVHLWADAARAAGTLDPTAVAAAVRGRGFEGPGSRIRIDPQNGHAWLPVRIGKIQKDGSVAVVPNAGSEQPVRPVPFPPTRTPAAWDLFLRERQMEWGGRWQAPEKK